MEALYDGRGIDEVAAAQDTQQMRVETRQLETGCPMHPTQTYIISIGIDVTQTDKHRGLAYIYHTNKQFTSHKQAIVVH